MSTTILIVDDSRVTREVTKVYLIAKDVAFLEAPYQPVENLLSIGYS